ncbi:hypothetical protein H0A73_22620 [Alcaligenaceae bacterium]|nr:hypothetical protein [Alcaligenaceae bacterium]
MSENKSEVQDVIEALQAAQYVRRIWASGEESNSRVSQIARGLVYIAEAQHGEGKAGHDVRVKVAQALAEAWNLDITPRLDSAGRLRV